MFSNQAIIECVPNFSEGRSIQVIEQIAAAIRTTSGVRLLHVDPDWDTHRTVMTFIATPTTVIDAALNMAAAALQHIDMRLHHGVHPRLGALDVCPIIPLRGATIEQCAALAESLAKQMAQRFDLPAFLYGNAAKQPIRRELANIRRGEYEGLESKLRQAEWAPDQGPTIFSPTSGALCVGARDLLIAYNVNLATQDVGIAKQLAGKLRESGSGGHPGRFKGLKAIGWYLPRLQRVQVSMNITKIAAAPLHEVYLAIQNLAAQAGTQVLGSQIIGMVPKTALLQAGQHFHKAAGAAPEDYLSAAVDGLGLSQMSAFDPAQKVLDLEALSIRD